MKQLVMILSAGVLALGGCDKSGDAGPSLPGSKSGAATAAAPGGTIALTGAGATFPYPLYSKWIADYGRAHERVAINYQSIGSGGGIRQITERTVDFGASDAPMSDEQLEKAKGVIHIPTCVGAVAVTYNVEGVSSPLKLTQAAVAGIFAGTIANWDDPAIAKENPDAKLPHKPIATVHRSDGSGTTKIFTDYLSAVSTTWKTGPGAGTSVRWPNGLGAKGNEGVAAQVKSTPNAVGYVELAYAVQNHLAFASLENQAGQFVLPSLEAATEAAVGALARMPEDFRVSIVNAEGKGAYPISAFTYLLVYDRQQDAVKGEALVDFVHWAVHDGQSATKPLDYAPLPPELVQKIDRKLGQVTGPDGKPLLRS